MGFTCGIVGLPNVGKSTLFNTLTNAGAAAENFPFCTVEPNTGIVPVPDDRLDRIAKISGSKRIVHGSMTFVDIAGLIKGASQGEGLGNRFLSHIREMDALVHVVRCFEDDNVVHVEGSVAPQRDIDTVNTELILADLETAQRIRNSIVKLAKTGDSDARKALNLLERVIENLDTGVPVRVVEFNDQESVLVRSWHFVTSKPVLYIANIGEADFEGSTYIDIVSAVAREDHAEYVSVCSSIESELQELGAEERAEYLEELGVSEPGLNRVIRAGYKLLDLHHFFTTDEKESRAWTIKTGTAALQAAGKIHTDFERGFIRAEVITYEDFIKFGGETGAKSAGNWRLEGRDYVVCEGDVIRFRFNV